MLLDYALTTVARQQEYQGITGNEAILERLINSATDYIERYCQRRFKLSTYTNELLNGNNTCQISTKQFPIVTVTSFQYKTGESWDDVNSDDYEIDNDPGIIVTDFATTKGLRNYRTTYTAGYNYDNTTTFLSDVGLADLEWVCSELVKNFYNKKATTSDIQDESIGNYSVTYSDILNRNADIKDNLEYYRKPQIF